MIVRNDGEVDLLSLGLIRHRSKVKRQRSKARLKE
jgi:hypothetical protein